MKFMIILVAGIIILAGGFFAGSCYIRGNSAPPPEPPIHADACIAAVLKVNPDPELLALIQRGVDRKFTSAQERIALRETLRRLGLPACDRLRQSITPSTPPPTGTP